jgi:hypothetical protein
MRAAAVAAAVVPKCSNQTKKEEISITKKGGFRLSQPKPREEKGKKEARKEGKEDAKGIFLH